MDYNLPIWLDEVLKTLADARAVLASFGVRDRVLEARIEAALAVAYALKRGNLRP